MGTKYVTSSDNTYKVYTALLTQTGSTAPTEVILENTLGTVTYSYQSTGDYLVTATGLLTTDKTAINCGVGSMEISSLTNDSFTLFTFDLAAASLSDDILRSSMIEIKVYN